MTDATSDSGAGDDEVTWSAEDALPQSDANRARAGTLLLRVLVTGEYVLLYVISSVLLILAAGILIAVLVSVAQSRGSWPEQFIDVIEELLLILIVLEIFITVVHHLRGGRLRLEPFIVVAVIAVVRHILSIVIRLAVPGTAPVSRDQLIELAINAGVVFVLVAALALARWSQRRTSET